MTPGEKGVHTQLFHTPPIDKETFLPELPWAGLEKVHWESHTSWEDVARQQGSIERVIFPAAAEGAAAAKEKKEEGSAKKEEEKKSKR